MKVLLATDGSPDGRCAEQLVKSVHWPTATHLTLLHVDAPLEGDSELPDPALKALHDDLRGEIGLHLDALRREMAKAHPRVKLDTALPPGRPPSAIVKEARAMRADLVVLGSRGHGAVASGLIGSVAAEVMDHAPCPVLVARTSGIRGVVVADDGSDGARQAEDVIASWPFLRGLPIRVVSVADMSPLSTGFASGVDVGVQETYAQMLDDLQHERESTAREGAKRLKGLGAKVTSEARSGYVSREIMSCASQRKADLIVVGSRGRTGLRRLVLGSVARSVLFNAPVSVLIVRQAADLPARASDR